MVGSECPKCYEVGEGLVWREVVLALLFRVFRLLDSTSLLLRLHSFLECLRQFQLLKIVLFICCKCCEGLGQHSRSSFLVMCFKVF